MSSERVGVDLNERSLEGKVDNWEIPEPEMRREVKSVATLVVPGNKGEVGSLQVGLD